MKQAGPVETPDPPDRRRASKLYLATGVVRAVRPPCGPFGPWTVVDVRAQDVVNKQTGDVTRIAARWGFECAITLAMKSKADYRLPAIGDEVAILVNPIDALQEGRVIHSLTRPNKRQ